MILDFIIIIIPDNFNSILTELVFLHYFGTFYLYIAFAIIALITQCLFVLINTLLHHNLSVQNSFLLHNKTYSCIYFAGFSYTTICIIMFFLICIIL